MNYKKVTIFVAAFLVGAFLTGIVASAAPRDQSAEDPLVIKIKADMANCKKMLAKTGATPAKSPTYTYMLTECINKLGTGQYAVIDIRNYPFHKKP